MSLGVWLLLFTAVLYTWVVELLWLRRSNDARRHLRNGTTAHSEDVGDGGNQ